MDKIQTGHPDKKVEVWYGLGKSSRPGAVRQTKYEWLYVIGAVCLQTEQSVDLLSPHINTVVTAVFLEQFVRELRSDVHVVLVWDKTGFHIKN